MSVAHPVIRCKAFSSHSKCASHSTDCVTIYTIVTVTMHRILSATPSHTLYVYSPDSVRPMPAYSFYAYTFQTSKYRCAHIGKFFELSRKQKACSLLTPKDGSNVLHVSGYFKMTLRTCVEIENLRLP